MRRLGLAAPAPLKLSIREPRLSVAFHASNHAQATQSFLFPTPGCGRHRAMNSRNTWIYVTLALGLFVFIWIHERQPTQAPSGLPPVLPGLQPTNVTSVRVRLTGQLEIQVERTNDGWQLIRPRQAPAENALIEGLLAYLAGLHAQTFIPAWELRQQTNVDEAFGFDPPQASVLLQQAGERQQLLVGGRTLPGDQVFVQVVGAEGIYVVESELLQGLPRNPNDWRNAALLRQPNRAFDRLIVTNAGSTFTLQREAASGRWRLTHPMQVRADSAKVDDALAALGQTRIVQFVTDDPQADLEVFGLQPPEFSLTFRDGTNVVRELRLGHSSTNETHLAYVRLQDAPTVMLVPREPFTVWRAKFEDFRDRHLLELAHPVARIEVQGEDTFTLQRQADDTWRLLPQDLPGDAEAIAHLLATLGELQVRRFVKDVVTPPDLPGFGLAAPARQFTLRQAEPLPDHTNNVLGEIQFGGTEGEYTYARRTDESAVYAVDTSEIRTLPAAGFQMRQRELWHFDTERVTGLLIQQGESRRRLVRLGADSWSLAPGSEGIINVFGVEETVYRLGELRAVAWTAVGEEHLSRFGFRPDSLRVTVEFKTGDHLDVQFGGTAPSGLTYAATRLEGRIWIFECPPGISQLALTYLSLSRPAP